MRGTAEAAHRCAQGDIAVTPIDSVPFAGKRKPHKRVGFWVWGRHNRDCVRSSCLMTPAQHPRTCSRKQDTHVPAARSELALLRRLARRALCWITVVFLSLSNWLFLGAPGVGGLPADERSLLCLRPPHQRRVVRRPDTRC